MELKLSLVDTQDETVLILIIMEDTHGDTTNFLQVGNA